MYGQFKDIPENIKKRVEALYGISYSEWNKLSHIINESFKKKRGEADKSLCLSSEADIFNPF